MNQALPDALNNEITNWAPNSCGDLARLTGTMERLSKV